MRTPGLCQNKVPAKKVITEKPDLDRGCLPARDPSIHPRPRVSAAFPPESNRNVDATKDLRNRRRVCLGRARRGHWREGALRKRGGLVLVFFKRRPMRAMAPRLAPPSTRTLRPLAPPERLLRTSTTVCRSLRGPGARQRPGTGSLHEQLPGGARDMV